MANKLEDDWRKLLSMAEDEVNPFRDPPSWLVVMYVLAAFLFIIAIHGLGDQITARKGNLAGIIGMGIAIISVYIWANTDDDISYIYKNDSEET
eukprot:1314232-Ditylum_brightwellii.AAC.1